MGNAVSFARWLATAAVVGLSAAQPNFPSDTWIPYVIMALGLVGIHAIPSSTQVAKPLGLLPSFPTVKLSPAPPANVAQKYTDVGQGSTWQSTTQSSTPTRLSPDVPPPPPQDAA